MKNIIFLGAVLITLSFISCDDFLTESSQDEVRPNTTTDLEELLLGEGYASRTPIFPYLELLTDNVESNYSNATGQETMLLNGAPVFTWAEDMYEQLQKNNVPWYNSWQNLYHWINGCNVVIDQLPLVTGSKQAKERLKAEALGLRSFYYFMLVNAYAVPYNTEDSGANTAPGIPLILKSTVKDEFPKRNSVAEVYEQIVKDLLEARNLFAKNGVVNHSVYTVSPLFIDMLLARVYLYEGKWDEVIKYSSSVIEQKPALLKLRQFYTYDEWQGVVMYDIAKGGIYNSSSPELIWGYSINGEYSAYFMGVNLYIDPGKLPAFTVSKELETMYTSNDIRREAYYNAYLVMNGFIPEKHLLVGRKSENVVQNPTKGMRVSEAYLNRAEAYARKYLLTKDEQMRMAALSDLNILREARFTEPYVKLEITNGEELLKSCLDERRRELSFEDHRWFDLRRLGMPAIQHTFSITNGQIQTYRLEKGSSKYVLPIAREVKDRNPELEK